MSIGFFCQWSCRTDLIVVHKFRIIVFLYFRFHYLPCGTFYFVFIRVFTKVAFKSNGVFNYRHV